MARNVNPETLAIARRFIEKHQHGPLTVDQLDMFLNDEGILPDLDFDRDAIKAEGRTLSAAEKQAWDGYVAARQNGRNLLNRGGKQLTNGEAFTLKTIKSGQDYEVCQLHVAAKQYFDREMSEKVREFTKNRLAHFGTLHNQLQWLMNNCLLEDMSAEALEVLQMYKTLDLSAQLMERKIDVITRQFDEAVAGASEQARVLIESVGGNGLPQIEDHSTNEGEA